MSTGTMSLPTPSPEEPLRAVLLRKLLLLSLSMLGVALVVAILFSLLRRPAYLLLVFASDFVLALVSAFLSRRIFRGHSGLLRFAAAYAVFILSLLLLGFFSGGLAGLGPLRIGRPDVDWTGLGQLLLGVGTVILALEAWPRPAVQIDPAPAVEIEVQPLPVAVQPAAGRPRVRAAPRSRRTPARRARRTARPKVEPVPEIVVAAPAKPRRRRGLGRNQPRLQLSKVEEHRCPYCLELIEPNDPRGTVECKICHTLHHADCWAITGTCQVPHLNS